MHSVTQLFSIVCVNAFFLIVTTVLALCNLCGITDSFYKFNFPIIVFTTLTTVTYAYDLICKYDGSIQAVLCP
ncbi:hypothetical protein Y032_0151g2797 [Ancylostoma ceylanicum]|nr:hypothetical protein Y032_0151g2797 [Ancylostoma ceylanicum]